MADQPGHSQVWWRFFIRVFPKIGGKPPKMDGENSGKPITHILGNTHKGLVDNSNGTWGAIILSELGTGL